MVMTVDEMKAEIERQDQQLEELRETLARFDRIDVPPSFFAELDAACELRVEPTMATSFSHLQLGLRA